MKWTLPVQLSLSVQLSLIFLLQTYVSGKIDPGAELIEKYQKRLDTMEVGVEEFRVKIETMLVEKNGTRNSPNLEKLAARMDEFEKTENLNGFDNEISAWFNQVTQMLDSKLDPELASKLSGKFLASAQTQSQKTGPATPAQPAATIEKTKLTIEIPPVISPSSQQQPPSKVQRAAVSSTNTNDLQNDNATGMEESDSPSYADYQTPSSGSPNQFATNQLPQQNSIFGNTSQPASSNSNLPIFNPSEHDGFKLGPLASNKRPGSGGKNRRPGSGGRKGRPGSGGRKGRPGSGGRRNGPNVNTFQTAGQPVTNTKTVRVQRRRVEEEHLAISANSEADGSDNSGGMTPDMTRAVWG
ncbi:hypothetical protein Ddc_09953 [Ditylenchus destructor]|nr:hypothetical protein Ddc_09953 [Ditylenchus destructor]